MVATDDTATTSPALTNPPAFHLGERLAVLFDADAAGRAAIKDTATTAYVAASAYSDLGDRPNGLLWITRAGEESSVALQAALQAGRNQ